MLILATLSTPVGTKPWYERAMAMATSKGDDPAQGVRHFVGSQGRSEGTPCDHRTDIVEGESADQGPDRRTPAVPWRDAGLRSADRFRSEATGRRTDQT